jgi:glycosyltransferase involved in cell wall biosynthesis
VTRILHIEKFVRRDRGGASDYMFEVMDRQRRAGHEVDVFGMASAENEPTRYGDRFAPHVQLDPPPPGAVAKARTALRMIWSTPAAGALADVLDDFRPDVVHCHNIYHQLTPSILGPVSSRSIPTVMTVHDFKLVCPTYHLIDHQGNDCTECVGASVMPLLRKRCEAGSLAKSAVLAVEATVHRRRHSYGSIARFLCPSRFMVDQLVAGGFSPERIRHLPNAVAIPADGDPNRRPPPGQHLVFVGRLIHRKGVDLLIDAIGPLEGVTLTVCGDGPERAGLEERARSLGGRVEFAGHVDHQRLRRELGKAAALVLPSRGSENQPLSILEAFANGVPVVASDSAPIRELVEAGTTGLLFSSGSVATLTATLTELLADPDRRATMAGEAWKLACANHDMADHVASLDHVYAEVG